MPLIDFGRIAARAALVRQRCGFFDQEPPYSTVKMGSVCFPDIRVTGAVLPEGMLEMTEAGLGRRVLYYNKTVAHSVRRVGIAHGFHHHLTDLRNPTDSDARECNRARSIFERDAGIRPSPVELACDLFAGEVLVPFDRLDEYAPEILFPSELRAQIGFEDEIARLASRFNVPDWFIEWRLQDLQHLRRTNLHI